MNPKKYRTYSTVEMKERKWPSNSIRKSPIWCSVDLRDGNQALEIPMTLNQKIKMFQTLVGMGFKEIEVGFPAASETEFNFVRKLIEEDLIPEDVTIQVLTQARKHIIEKTFEAIKGAKHSIVHLYNSTSTIQRNVVFKKNKQEIVDIAVEGAKLVKELSRGEDSGEIIWEYSPESFTGTEIDFAIEICGAVLDIWKPTKEKKAIINLPSTVEMTTPNVYADQIEYCCNHMPYRDAVTVSVHAHNDRGTAVAATELAMLAGADRVEGTLFGNGERTGNADLLTLGMNLFSQGIDPKLDFSKIDNIKKLYEETTGMTVHPRHPYGGDLVYTAFSGSHQDAIQKGMDWYRRENPEYWEVPYLPIDPMDVGRNYEPIIRINSQSGKGGVAYILETEYHIQLPKALKQEFGGAITAISDKNKREISPETIYKTFMNEYVNVDYPLKWINYAIDKQEKETRIKLQLRINNEFRKIEGQGNGPLDAACNAVNKLGIAIFRFISYDEHSLEQGSDAQAITYIHIQNEKRVDFFGVGIDKNINTSSIKALISAVNRSIK